MKYQVDILTKQIETAKKIIYEQDIQLGMKPENFKWQENLKKQLKNQEEEIKVLKTKVDDLTKEVQKLKDYGKSKTYVEEPEGTSEVISNLKIQIEEAKRVEEVLKT